MKIALFVVMFLFSNEGRADIGKTASNLPPSQAIAENSGESAVFQSGIINQKVSSAGLYVVTADRHQEWADILRKSPVLRRPPSMPESEDFLVTADQHQTAANRLRASAVRIYNEAAEWHQDQANLLRNKTVTETAWQRAWSAYIHDKYAEWYQKESDRLTDLIATTLQEDPQQLADTFFRKDFSNPGFTEY